MNHIARLITTALIAAMAFVAVPATAQADQPPGTAPSECDPLTSPPGACDPGTAPSECDPLTSPPGACDPGTCEAAPAAVEPATQPGAISSSRAGDPEKIARLQAKVQQLRDRLRSR